jgi:hypothetical protein
VNVQTIIRRRGVSQLRTSGSLLLIAYRLSLIAYCLLLSLSCSIPNLEPPECDQARDRVREFYSFHFGNELRSEPDDLEKRKGYLTPRFFQRLSGGQPSVDPFTLMADPPKAFRAGECRVIEPGKRVTFELLLFWKTDTRSEQRSIQVESENQNGVWLIDKVENRQP